ncbi:MAG: cysteine protease [Prevotella sp.]|nr:cysteine protease [Prevotella sp.]
MKRFSFSILLIVLLTATGCRNDKPTDDAGKGRYLFTDVVRLKTTPVKYQGKNQLCWAYAMLATIETEHLEAGDSVNLSPDYIARVYLSELVGNYFFSRQKSDISMRGMAPMLVHLIQKYGIEPFDTYFCPEAINYNVVCRKLQKIADSASSKEQLEGNMEQFFDDNIGFLPRFVFMASVEYTPLEFAHSVCRRNEYEWITSFSHHPFYESFELEVPDNVFHDEFFNLPIDSLMAHIDTALLHHHAVCWEGDTSEPGFSFAEGVAELKGRWPADVRKLQQQRQRLFEKGRTTDDHCMALVGIAHGEDGRKYYLAKNSWGTNNPYGGLMYLSEDYVAMKTIAVGMPEEFRETRK